MTKRADGFYWVYDPNTGWQVATFGEIGGGMKGRWCILGVEQTFTDAQLRSFFEVKKLEIKGPFSPPPTPLR